MKCLTCKYRLDVKSARNDVHYCNAPLPVLPWLPDVEDYRYIYEDEDMKSCTVYSPKEED